jgi:DNA-binding XRE family transcriptional regulator
VKRTMQPLPAGRQAFKHDDEVEQIIKRTITKIRGWGITVTYLATQLGVSRQYVWQVVYYRTMVSRQKAREVEAAVDSIIALQKHLQTYGDRLRAARISAGLTLKQVAEKIGYSWVGVERWEKNVCLPKPGVLWHLRTLYGVDEGWLQPGLRQDQQLAPAMAHWQGGIEQRQVA